VTQRNYRAHDAHAPSPTPTESGRLARCPAPTMLAPRHQPQRRAGVSPAAPRPTCPRSVTNPNGERASRPLPRAHVARAPSPTPKESGRLARCTAPTLPALRHQPQRRAGVSPAAPHPRCPHSVANPNGERASRPLHRTHDARAPSPAPTESGRLARCPAAKMAPLGGAQRTARPIVLTNPTPLTETSEHEPPFLDRLDVALTHRR